MAAVSLFDLASVQASMIEAGCPATAILPAIPSLNAERGRLYHLAALCRLVEGECQCAAGSPYRHSRRPRDYVLR